MFQVLAKLDTSWVQLKSQWLNNTRVMAKLDMSFFGFDQKINFMS